MKYRFKDIMLKAATILPAIVFMLAGAAKIADPSASYTRVEEWGYPGWLSMVIGAIELVFGVLLAVPSLAGLAAMVLGIDMLGALFTHMRAGQYGMLLVPGLLFLAMAYVDATLKNDLLTMMDKAMDRMHIPHRTHHV